MNETQAEIERLREEVADLRKALADRQLPQPTTSTATPLINNHEFISDLARFADDTLEEKYIRWKYHLLDEKTWELLGKDEALIEKIEEQRILRIRSGATKRERAQKHIIAAPDLLNGIMTDPKANHRHVVDAIKTLDNLAEGGPRAAHDDSDRVRVVINLTADTKAKGQEIDPTDVLIIDAEVRPTDGKVIEATPLAADNVDQQEAIPPKRGPGRPPGSKNKPKPIEHDSSTPPLPGFAV